MHWLSMSGWGMTNTLCQLLDTPSNLTNFGCRIAWQIMEEVPSLKTSSSSDEEFESRDEECKPSEDDNQYKLQDGNISNPAAPPPPEEEDEKSVDIFLDEEQIIYSDVIFRLQRQIKVGKNANLSNSQNEKKQENEAEESGLQSMLFDNYVTENKKPKKSLSRKRIRKSAELPAYP